MMSEDGINKSSMDGSSEGCSKGELGACVSSTPEGNCDGISTTTIPCVGLCDLSLEGSSDERGKEPGEGIGIAGPKKSGISSEGRPEGSLEGVVLEGLPPLEGGGVLDGTLFCVDMEGVCTDGVGRLENEDVLEGPSDGISKGRCWDGT
jgi:hypothetical protein